MERSNTPAPLKGYTKPGRSGRSGSRSSVNQPVRLADIGFDLLQHRSLALRKTGPGTSFGQREARVATPEPHRSVPVKVKSRVATPSLYHAQQDHRRASG